MLPLGLAPGLACCNTPSPLTPLFLAQVRVATCTVRPLAEQVAAPAAIVAAEQEQVKKSKKKAKRVRDPYRSHGDRAALEKVRLALPPPRTNEVRALKQVESSVEAQDAMRRVAPPFCVRDKPELVAGLDALLLAVDREPEAAWIADKRKMLAPETQHRTQLAIPLRRGGGRASPAVKEVCLAVCAQLQAVAPMCPRCAHPLCDHPLSEVTVNRYPKGSGFCIHRDGEEGVVLSVALPVEWQGGFFRVALKPGPFGVQLRGQMRGSTCVARSIADAVPKRAGQMFHVPMQCYSGVVFDGPGHYHELSEVTDGMRCSLVIGFKSCKPSMSL